MAPSTARLAAAALLCAHATALLQSEDFLVDRPPSVSRLDTNADGSLTLTNGLISRRFVTRPNFATVSLRNEEPHDLGGPLEALRGVGPEARVTFGCGEPDGRGRRLLPFAPDALEGTTDPNVTGSSKVSAGIAVGGLRGQRRYALLDMDQWNWTAGRHDFRYVSHETRAPTAEWGWTPGQRHSSARATWPPRGIQLRVRFRPPTRCGCYCGTRVTVVYELHDDIPTMSKWIYVAVSPFHVAPIVVRTLVSEELHVAEHAKTRLHVATDYMPRKTDASAFAQPPSADPRRGMYTGTCMNYPIWWIDPDYEDDARDQVMIYLGVYLGEYLGELVD